MNAQVLKAIPADANEFYETSFPLLRTPIKKIILQTAETLKRHTINADSLAEALHKNPELKGMSKNDLEGITVLIMVQATKDADADLKKMVMEISHNDKNNSTDDNITASQNSKLQMIMNRKSDMAEEIGYVMKKISGSQQDIIDSLK